MNISNSYFQNAEDNTFAPGAVVSSTEFGQKRSLSRSYIPFEGKLYLSVRYGTDYKTYKHYYLEIPKNRVKMWKGCNHWFAPRTGEPEVRYRHRMDRIRSEIEAKLVKG